MQTTPFDQDAAWEILNRHVHGESLIRHSITVEAVMRHFASLFGEDPETWGVIGLLHDVDFEEYPERHCLKTRELLEGTGCPEDVIRAAESHGYGLTCDVKPETNAEKTLYTVDELTGLISATAIMRPSKSLSDLGVSSVKKKWKSKGFAVNVDRDVIARGAEMLGMELEKVIAETIEGMKPVAGRIGLQGIE